MVVFSINKDKSPRHPYFSTLFHDSQEQSQSISCVESRKYGNRR